MSANDKDEFVCRETEWIGVALKEEKPFLGICLGAQMLANHLGAKVGFHADEMTEIGYYPLLTTSDGLALGRFPDHVYQWHREGFELARGARLLATSTGAYPNQAFGYGSGIGFQFHPEITYAQVHRWTGHNNTRLGMKGARAPFYTAEVCWPGQPTIRPASLGTRYITRSLMASSPWLVPGCGMQSRLKPQRSASNGSVSKCRFGSPSMPKVELMGLSQSTWNSHIDTRSVSKPKSASSTSMT